jgi:predicted DNA-binding protein with PD1-like motif
MDSSKKQGQTLEAQEKETFSGEAWKKHLGEMRFHGVPGRGGTLISGRLLAGADMVGGILEMARSHDIKAGIVATAFGSLAKARLSLGGRHAAQPGRMERIPPMEIEGPVEFLCGQGKFGFPREGDPVVHFHGVLVTSDGQVMGGHFFPGGNPVLITFEVAIQEILDLEHLWHWEEESGIFLVHPEKGNVP